MRDESTLLRTALLLLLPVVGGCASWRASFNEAVTAEASEQYESVDRHSSYPALRRKNFEQVNLLELIDPKHELVASGMKTWDVDDTETNYGRKYDLAFAWFRTNGHPPEAKRLQRNSVQDRILAVSTSRCNVYKTFLRRQQSDVNFGLGSLTTFAGVLGAILPGATAARSLAGTAGLFSGVQAEYNQAYFSNLAAHVVVQAIELRQNRLRKELVEARQGKGIDDYSLEAAISDAIAIDGNCSALAGLIEAQDSIKEVETPGLRMAARAITGARALQELGGSSVSDLQKNGTYEALMSVASGSVPSLLVTSVQTGGVSGSLGVTVTGAANVVDAVAAQADLQGGFLAKAFDLRNKASDEDKRSKLMPAEVGDALRSKLVEKLDLSNAKEPFKTCAAKLKAAASDLGAKNANLMVSQGDKVESAKALQEVEVAQSNVRLAMTRLDLVRDEARSRVLALGTAAQKSLSHADLAVLDKSALTALIANLPFDQNKVSSSCV